MSIAKINKLNEVAAFFTLNGKRHLSNSKAKAAKTKALGIAISFVWASLITACILLVYSIAFVFISNFSLFEEKSLI